jgi:hypothetical protein
MSPDHDYSAVRSAIARAAEILDRASRRGRLTNLPPGMNPGGVHAQIDEIDVLLTDAAEELMAARQACTRIARRSLTLVSSA